MYKYSFCSGSFNEDLNIYTQLSFTLVLRIYIRLDPDATAHTCIFVFA
jgi:hypothetical protein